jgi:cytochrome c nitrite reductase small subunit
MGGDRSDPGGPGRYLNPLLGLHPVRRVLDLVERMAGGRLGLALAALAGAAAGLGLLAIQVSSARSYLSDAPEACINCHVMTGSYAGWAHSSHRGVTTCNDCHVPHESAARKIAFKMKDGAWHSFAFTFRLEPQVLELNEHASPVVQRNCARCHEQQIMNTQMASSDGELRCWHCHRETPHGLSHSLSSAPHVRRPVLPTAGMPELAKRDEP